MGLIFNLILIKSYKIKGLILNLKLIKYKSKATKLKG